MNLNQLRILDLISQGNSMNSVAKVMVTSAQSINNQIASMEKEIGIKLIDRTPKGSCLNKNGEALLPYARKILKTYNEGLKVIKQTKVINVGVVRLLIPEWILHFRDSYNSILKDYTINLIVKNSYEEVLDSFENGETDILLCHTEINVDASFLPLFEDEIYILMSEKNPLSTQKPLNLESLKNSKIHLGLEDSFLANPFTVLRSQFDECTIIPSRIERMTLDTIADSDRDIAFVYGIIMPEITLPKNMVGRKLQDETVTFGMYYQSDNPAARSFVRELSRMQKSKKR